MNNIVIKIVIGLVVIGAIVGLVFVGINAGKQSATEKAALDELAICVTETDATFWGAFWCSACQAQKAAFKQSKELPYVECSKADKSQTQECIDAGIQSYPTWDFADGERIVGVLTPAELAEKTNCTLPEGI